MAPGPASSFEHRKLTFLSKSDKSSAGEIDEKAREVCAELNSRPAFYTTSSCAGRAFIWRGDGVKSTECFSRWRVTHDLVEDPPEKYFDLASLEGKCANSASTSRVVQASSGCSCWTGLLSIGSRGSSGQSRRQDVWEGRRHQQHARAEMADENGDGGSAVYWLRFEPFILHVCCRDFAAASALMGAARTVFKNVGVQGWGESSKLIVAIWGDEGLDMPLTGPTGIPLFEGEDAWLQELVNSRHGRNWGKIDRFTAALRAMEDPLPAAERITSLQDSFGGSEDLQAFEFDGTSGKRRPGPRHFDIVGDVAVLHSRPKEDELSTVGEAILAEARQVKVVAVRSSALSTELRKPTEAFEIIAGRNKDSRQRSPLMTTHSEFGVKIVVDLDASFFSTRLAGERQRLCSLTQPGEHVLVAFAGCGPEVLQLAARPEASSITAVEMNPAAVRCAQRGLQLLQRSGNAGAAESRVNILEGDLRKLASALPQNHFHRVLAPRPKGPGDGDGGGDSQSDGKAVSGGDSGADFLAVLLPVLCDGGVCHWYDFAADWELPDCERTCALLRDACTSRGWSCQILHCAAANRRSIAERQYRVVVDFKVLKSA